LKGRRFNMRKARAASADSSAAGAAPVFYSTSSEKRANLERL
jgi:hypothetical protein